MPIDVRAALVALACALTWLVATPALAQRSTPVQLLHPSGSPFDNFGRSIAIDGDTMIVGSWTDDVGSTTNQGSAHVYRWTGSGWTFEATLTASDGAADDVFGASVAISGDTAIVGAFADSMGSIASQGSAYIFVRTPGATTWSQQAKLTATDGGFADYFGYSVAVNGDTAVVGAYRDDSGAGAEQGSAYIFARSPGGATWTQQAKLTAADGGVGDRFGFSVALSGDIVMVGASLDDVGANTDQGTAYIFTRSGSTWSQHAQLTAADGAAGDLFGRSVALSGQTIIVGASGDDVGVNNNQGSAYVYTRSGTLWTQQAKLTATDGADGDLFGTAVALSGDSALVGASNDRVDIEVGQGSTFAFTRSGSVWTQQAQLTAPDGAMGDNFGSAVALSGDLAVAGSPVDNNLAGTGQGSVWVFSRIGSTWIGSDFTMFASDGGPVDWLGYSVALSGDTAIVAAPVDDDGGGFDAGSVYVFVRSGSAWIQQARLISSDPGNGDRFGSSVSISGNTAAVTAPFDDVLPNFDLGSVYIFTRSGTTWTQQAKLNAADGTGNDQFGGSVALSGDTLIVGCNFDDLGSNVNQGSAYIFTRSGTTWTQQAKLTAADGAANDQFGISVTLSGDTALVGASGDDVASNNDQGSAYIFTRSGSTWTQQARLSASDGAAGDNFGSSVSLSGETALVGSVSDDVGSNSNQGSAYVFTRSGSSWTQQGKLTAADGETDDQFGYAASISGDAALVGARFDDVGINSNQGSAYVFARTGNAWAQLSKLTVTDGASGDNLGAAVALAGSMAIVGSPFDDQGPNSNQGSARIFDVPANDFSNARNDTTGFSYPTLADALLPAASGQQITATEAAWRTGGSVNTLGRSLALLGAANVRTPSTSIIDLGGASVFAATAGSIDIYGQLRTASSSSADLFADAFTLGSRGSLTANTNSSLTINAPDARLQGQTRLEEDASLTFAGSATTIGPITANLNSSLTAGGIFTNIDTFTITSGTITTPLFDNRSLLNVFGSSAVFGSFTNDAGAVTTIRSGTLFVFGSLTNNGTIVGTLCSNCIATPPNLDVGGSLVLGPTANLNFPFADSLISVGGDFDNAINSNTRVDTALATLQLQGSSGGSIEQSLEVMSTDIGRSTVGLDRTFEGNYPIGTLHIGPSPSIVRLVDAHDNDNLGQDACEAIYVDTLRIDAGSRLINTSCLIYYSTLINDGVVDVPENLRSLACRADVDGFPGVDFGDFLAFFNCFDAEQPCADVDGNPGVDFGDFLAFFNDFDAGCL